MKAPELATPDDIDQIFELTYLMWADMGYANPDRSWEPGARAELTRQIASGMSAAFVIRDPRDSTRLLASGIAMIHQRLPQWWCPTGRIGHVCWMSTRAEHRNKGFGAAVLQSILDWFVANNTAIADLNATESGAGLYQKAGFEAPTYSLLRWHAPSVS